MHRLWQIILTTITCGLVTSPLWAAGPDRDSFVRVSPRDSRYFELSNSRPYIPIGFNLVSAPTMDELPALLDTMANHRINYCRIWADQPPWAVETRRSGEYDQQGLVNLKRFFDLCRQRKIRVKVCLEHFRDIRPERSRWSDKPLHHRANGGRFSSMTEFLESAEGIRQFQGKLAWYAEQIGDEPAVFAWELWNEMNAVRGPWLPWTEIMLPELERLFPNNMVVQSLGSFDRDACREPYRQLCLLKGNDIAQVHRYLDLGAQLTVCHGPVDVLAADAVAELQAFQAGKPIILTETGAVKPSHSGCSELYAKDREGMLLHDMLFAPFFAGAAGTGHVWWWRQSLEDPKMWKHFARFAAVVEGIDPAAERFVVRQYVQGTMRVYVLEGQRTWLVWCRDTRNNWKTELIEGQEPPRNEHVSLQVKPYSKPLAQARLRTFNPWSGRWQDAQLQDGAIQLPSFRRSLVVRADLQQPAHEK